MILIDSDVFYWWLVSPEKLSWLLAAELEWSHKYPADRMLVAMAVNRNISILTKDDLLHHADCPVDAIG